MKNEKCDSGFERADEFTFTSVGDFERHRFERLMENNMENDVSEVHLIAVVNIPNEFVGESDLGWKKALDSEITSLKSMSVFTEVEKSDVPKGVKVHGARWVLTLMNYDKLRSDRHGEMP